MRQGAVARATKETSIDVALDLDGAGAVTVTTGTEVASLVNGFMIKPVAPASRALPPWVASSSAVTMNKGKEQ